MQVHEVGALARPPERLAGVQVRRRLDLDDVGAPVGKLAYAGGTRAYPGQVQHSES